MLFRSYYEIGPGRILAGLMRRINRRADFVSLNSLQAVEELARQLRKDAGTGEARNDW